MGLEPCARHSRPCRQGRGVNPRRFVSMNHPGVSGDFVLWEGWSHVVRIAEEVPAGVA